MARGRLGPEPSTLLDRGTAHWALLGNYAKTGHVKRVRCASTTAVRVDGGAMWPQRIKSHLERRVRPASALMSELCKSGRGCGRGRGRTDRASSGTVRVRVLGAARTQWDAKAAPLESTQPGGFREGATCPYGVRASSPRSWLPGAGCSCTHVPLEAANACHSALDWWKGTRPPFAPLELEASTSSTRGTK